MLKKFIASALTAVMAVSLIASPVKADVGNSTENVVEQTVTQNGSQQCDVNASRGVMYTVTIPKNITLSGETKKAAYEVNVAGDITGNDTVKVVPDESFALKEDGGKADVTATVTQQKTAWTFADTMVRNAEDTAYVGTSTTGEVSAPITSGTWKGHFFFNIGLESEDAAEQPVTLAPGLYDADGNKIADLTVEQFEYNGSLPVESARATMIVIPDDVTSIRDFAFDYCLALESVTIPNSVTTIGECAFRDCSALTSINIPDSVVSIGKYAFNNCSVLTSINIPDGVTSINEGTFSGCSALTSVSIPDSVTSISSYAFKDCEALTSVTIPDSVTFITNSAFTGCSALTTIYYNGTAAYAPWGATNATVVNQ